MLYILTFELIKHTDGLDDIPRVGKNLNDVVLHGAHHTEPWLETCNRNRWKKNTHGHKRNDNRYAFATFIYL